MVWRRRRLGGIVHPRSEFSCVSKRNRLAMKLTFNVRQPYLASPTFTFEVYPTFKDVKSHVYLLSFFTRPCGLYEAYLLIVANVLSLRVISRGRVVFIFERHIMDNQSSKRIAQWENAFLLYCMVTLSSLKGALAGFQQTLLPSI